MAFETGLAIRIDPTGARQGGQVVRQELQAVSREARGTTQQMAGSFDRVRNTLFAVRSAVAAVAGAMAVRQFVQFADTANQLEARLRLVTSSATELALVQERLFQTAQDTRQGFEPTAELYARLARSTGELNLSSAELVSITETVGQAITISGASASQAQAGLLQFSQALAGGVLRAEEFNSIIEQTPRLAQALADGMGISLGELRRQVLEGTVTTERMLQALRDQADELEAEFALIPRTVSDAFTNLQNDVLKLVGVLDDGAGATEVLVQSIDDFRAVLADPAFQTGLGVVVGGIAQIGVEAGRAVREVGALVDLMRDPSWSDLGSFLTEGTFIGLARRTFEAGRDMFAGSDETAPGGAPETGGGAGVRRDGSIRLPPPGGGGGGTSATGPDIEEAVRVLRLRNIEQAQLNEALRRGRGEFEALEQAIDLEREAAELGIDSSSRLGREWIDLAREGQQLKNTFDELQEAQQNNDRAAEALERRMQGLRETMQFAIAERNLIGASPGVRAGAMAELQARQDVDHLRRNADVDPVAAERYIEAARAAAEYQEETRRIADTHRDLELIATSAFDRIGEAAIQSAMKGGNAFENFGDVVLSVLADVALQLAKVAIEQEKVASGAGGGGGGFFDFLGGVLNNLAGNVFGGGGFGGGIAISGVPASIGSIDVGGIGDVGMGFFAAGGRPAPGMPAIVGEAGPELFVPDRPGRIIPNHALAGGGSRSVDVTLNVNVDVRGARGNQEIEQMVNQGVARGFAEATPELERRIIAATRDDFSREGGAWL